MLRGGKKYHKDPLKRHVLGVAKALPPTCPRRECPHPSAFHYDADGVDSDRCTVLDCPCGKEQVVEEHVLKLKSDDSETHTWLLDGKEVASTNHDADGWAGMRAVGDALLTVARRLGWTIEGVGSR